MRHRFLFLLAASIWCGAAQAADPFPLNPGAVWEYRAEGVQEPLVIRVGLNQLFIFSESRVYSRLTGYVDEPLWVRLGADGDLLYLDEESGQDRLLTTFRLQSKDWFPAPFRPCQQEAQAQSDRVPYSGATGFLADTLAVRYRNLSCADAGVESEQFAANIGMVSRSVSTIAGPVVYKLVYADTGVAQLAPRTATALRLALHQNDDRSITANLRMSGDADAAPTLTFATSQEFDLILRDAHGTVVWKWSDGQFFTASLHERQAVNLAYEALIPPPPGGDYTVEAWLTTTDGERAPRVTAATHVAPEPAPETAFRPMRSRSRR